MPDDTLTDPWLEAAQMFAVKGLARQKKPDKESGSKGS